MARHFKGVKAPAVGPTRKLAILESSQLQSWQDWEVRRSRWPDILRELRHQLWALLEGLESWILQPWQGLLACWPAVLAGLAGLECFTNLRHQLWALLRR